jgi:hypothetical protein
MSPLVVIQAEHSVFCFSWFKGKLYRKITIGIIEKKKNSPHVTHFGVGSELLKVRVKLDVKFDWERNTGAFKGVFIKLWSTCGQMLFVNKYRVRQRNGRL